MLLIALLPWPSSALALPRAIQVDASHLRVEQVGYCEEQAASQNYPAAVTQAAARWDFEVIGTQPAEGRVFYVNSPFFFEADVRLPGAADWRRHSPVAAATHTGWPASLAVFPLPRALADGERFTLCVHSNFPLPLLAGFALEAELREDTLATVRRASLTEGTVGAMALAALGMSLALQRATFLLLAGGLTAAVIFLLASNGTLLDLPATVRLARDWPMQRLAGISCSLLIGWGLARYLELRQRQRWLWRVFLLATAIMVVLLLCSLGPEPLRFLPLSRYSNVAMVVLVLVLCASAAAGLVHRHVPSRTFLLSWLPLFAVVVWMSVAVRGDALWVTAPQWLLPLTLVYACSFLFTELARRVALARAERDRARERARIDDLTGALSRDELYQRLELLRGAALSGGSAWSILFVDFDHFKAVNDSYGHATGDAALVAALRRILSCLRSRDAVGRYGGEEFVVVLDGLAGEAACTVAERIRSDIENGGSAIAEGLPPLTVSIGVAGFDRPAEESVDALLARADAALYAAKAAGRNRVVVAPERDADARVVEKRRDA